MCVFDLIAFDADDTLWHNETLYARAQEQFKQLLRASRPEAADHAAEQIAQKLYEIEMRNLGQYGYGIKGFALSMIEAAIELTEGSITGQAIRRILDIAHEILNANVELVEHASSRPAR